MRQTYGLYYLCAWVSHICRDMKGITSKVYKRRLTGSVYLYISGNSRVLNPLAALWIK